MESTPLEFYPSHDPSQLRINKKKTQEENYSMLEKGGKLKNLNVSNKKTKKEEKNPGIKKN